MTAAFSLSANDFVIIDDTVVTSCFTKNRLFVRNVDIADLNKTDTIFHTAMFRVAASCSDIDIDNIVIHRATNTREIIRNIDKVFSLRWSSLNPVNEEWFHQFNVEEGDKLERVVDAIRQHYSDDVDPERLHFFLNTVAFFTATLDDKFPLAMKFIKRYFVASVSDVRVGVSVLFLKKISSPDGDVSRKSMKIAVDNIIDSGRTMFPKLGRDPAFFTVNINNFRVITSHSLFKVMAGVTSGLTLVSSHMEAIHIEQTW